jgi:hypothetical protein
VGAQGRNHLGITSLLFSGALDVGWSGYHMESNKDRHFVPFSLACALGQQQHSGGQNFADGYFLPNCHLSW